MTSVEILDPLARKELSGVSRRWQTWLARSLYVALIAFVVHQYWQDLLARASSVTTSDYADLARGLFFLSFWGQMVLVTVASVATSTDLLVREMKAGTLGLLLITPLPGRRIALGKWKAATAQGASLVLCGLPVTAICVYLGGVGPWELAWSTCLLVAAAALSSAYGLYYAAGHPAGERTFLAALVRILLFTLIPFVAFFAGPFAILVFFFAHPAWSGLAASLPQAFGVASSYGWISATVVSFLLARFLLWKAGNELLRWKPARQEAPPPAPTLEVLIRAGLHRPIHRPPVSERAPLLWKETALRDLAWGSPVKRGLLIAGFYAFSILYWAVWGDGSGGPLHALGLLLALLALGQGAAMFSPERERHAWDMLLSAPFAPGQIVRAKLLAGVLCGEGIAVGVVGFVNGIVLAHRSGISGVLLAGATSALFLAFAYLLGAAASLRARSLRSALLASGAALGLLLLLPPFLPAPIRETLSWADPRTVLDLLGPLPSEGSAASARFLVHAAVQAGSIALLYGSLVAAVRRRPSLPT